MALFSQVIVLIIINLCKDYLQTVDAESENLKLMLEKSSKDFEMLHKEIEELRSELNIEEPKEIIEELDEEEKEE